MNSKDSLALLAGLGQGYMNQTDKERQLKIEQANLDWQNNLRQRDQTAYELGVKQKADLIAAAAPQAPVATMQAPATADNIDVGQDASAAPVAKGGYTVNGTPYSDAASAQAAAVAANTPTAQMGRMSQALRVNGDPVAAAQLDMQARQAQLGNIQLSEAQRQQQQQQFNDHLLSVLPQGHKAIADFISNSQGDGNGGGLKATVVPTADGKSVQYKLTKPDGTSSLSPEFSNDKQGAVEAAFMLQQGMTPQMLVAHNEALTKDKREQQIADQTGTYHQVLGEAAMSRAEAAQARAETATVRAANAAQNSKDPVLQAELGITGKMLEQNTEQINKIYAADGYDPLKPPAGLAKLQSVQAALSQKILDLTAGKRHAGGVPAVFNQPTPGPKHDPNFVTPGIIGMPGTGPVPAAATIPTAPPTSVAPMAFMSPAYQAQRQKQQQDTDSSAAATRAFQKLLEQSQQAQMTHGGH